VYREKGGFDNKEGFKKENGETLEGGISEQGDWRQTLGCIGGGGERCGSEAKGKGYMRRKKV